MDGMLPFGRIYSMRYYLAQSGRGWSVSLPSTSSRRVPAEISMAIVESYNSGNEKSPKIR